MRFKGIKMGKSKEKDKKDKVEKAQAVAEEEQTASDESPEKGDEESQIPSELTTDEATQPGPHKPLAELSLDAAGDMEDDEFDAEISEGNLLEENKEEVKLVELKTENDAMAGEESSGLDTDAAAPEEKPKEKVKEEKPKSEDDSFSSLFVDTEEEENPLATLIDSLPDVSAQEIINDINELKEIMREGH
jgi:hypothetical protein